MTLRSLLTQDCLNDLRGLAEAAPSGAFVEVGVYQGGSAEVLYEVAMFHGHPLHLYDTFEGMPVADLDLDRHPLGDFADIDLAYLRRMLPAAHFHVGAFPGTLSDDPAQISFIHCDCDQYRSYKDVLQLLYPRLVPGGILLFDDYPYLAGAERAVLEHFAHGDLLRTRHERYYVVKP